MGCFDGVCVGDRVGSLLGDFVGILVGFFDGETVGLNIYTNKANIVLLCLLRVSRHDSSAIVMEFLKELFCGWRF